jgi:phosphatidylserine decarboxylase
VKAKLQAVKNFLFIVMQYVMPQHLISRVVGRLANTRIAIIKNTFVRWFIRRYGVDMSQAAEPDFRRYATFNDFFTRALKEGARPLSGEANAVLCPADGAINEIGSIDAGRLLQAKGRPYSLLALLGGDDEDARLFEGGHFATVYLSPKDYHRVHMPLTGRLSKMVYVPGQLFSVNDLTAQHVPDLFARNERLVCLFETDVGPMAVILVGAVIVAGIETVWAGQIAPPPKTAQATDYRSPLAPVTLAKGAEMGRFKLGSTAIVLFGPNVVQWEQHLGHASAVTMGQKLGTIVR